jgi:NAD-dependent dihydropyrimidine dehydrogenase PreA subunit
MTFVIGEACVDVMDRSCTKVCPVDCIYVGARKLYINPIECLDCGACEAECPVEAIYIDDDVPEEGQWFIADNADFLRRCCRIRKRPWAIQAARTTAARSAWTPHGSWRSRQRK